MAQTIAEAIAWLKDERQKRARAKEQGEKDQGKKGQIETRANNEEERA
jgi:hypothetical protein